MLCVCRKTCQMSIEGQSYLFKKGDTFEFKECPKWFEAIDDGKLDFQTASEEELLAATWKKAEAATFIKEKGGKLKSYEGITKADIVKQILDARFREVD